MGIQGLLPFLKKIHTPVNISQFQGCTVAIDAYCWLHKGAFSCADKLALGEKTEQYIYYCMKYVDYLLRNNLKPILVFDGCHLPSKKDVETARRERREMNRKRAAQLLREGKRSEARECLQRCIDITPQMALGLMNACRAQGVDCIVAPYEADAQLAYLNKVGIAQIVVTEDSDLLLFGCEKVIFKMDFYGNGILIERSRLNEIVEIQEGFYTFDKFRYMCILSGCDYLPSLPGIGLVKACKVFKMARQTDIRQLLKKLPSYLKMNLVVSDDYIEGFVRADNTFLYQLAFDPLTLKLCPLMPYSPEIDLKELKYAGSYFSNERALQIALGNIDIHTHEKIADFQPETTTPRDAKNKMLDKLSIWNPYYQPRSTADSAADSVPETTASRPYLKGKEKEVTNTLTKKTPVKRVREAEDSVEVKTDTELADLYSAPEVYLKKRRHHLEHGSIQLSADLPEALDSDSNEEFDSLKLDEEHVTDKKILSPSKLQNKKTDIVTAGDAFTLMDQESAHIIALEGKENKENCLTPPRNKFAVSALVKRPKFRIDASRNSTDKVEIRSRYFTTSSSIASREDTASGTRPTKSSPGKVQELISSESNNDVPAASVHNGSSPVDFCSKQENNHSSDFPQTPSRNVSFLSKFNYSSSRSSDKNSRHSRQAGSRSNSAQANRTQTSSQSSVFSWSSCKFMRSVSAPTTSASPTSSCSSNKPFRRVSSESINRRSTLSSSSKSGLLDKLCDTGKAEENDPEIDSSYPTKILRVLGDALPISQEGSGDCVSDNNWSQCSVEEAGLSQHSNLCSIDSDFSLSSQSSVGLTDCESGSQYTLGGGDGTFSSPASTSQIFLRSPKLTPRRSSGVAVKKCRVSGLSRGKKNTSVGDDKQQKIQDMFSRFAHQKCA